MCHLAHPSRQLSRRGRRPALALAIGLALAAPAALAQSGGGLGGLLGLEAPQAGAETAPAAAAGPGIDPLTAIPAPPPGDPLGAADRADCAALAADEAEKIGCGRAASRGAALAPAAAPGAAAAAEGAAGGTELAQAEPPAAEPAEPAPAPVLNPQLSPGLSRVLGFLKPKDAPAEEVVEDAAGETAGEAAEEAGAPAPEAAEASGAPEATGAAGAADASGGAPAVTGALGQALGLPLGGAGSAGEGAAGSGSGTAGGSETAGSGSAGAGTASGGEASGGGLLDLGLGGGTAAPEETAAGSDAAGSDTAGSDTAGGDTAGSGTAGGQPSGGGLLNLGLGGSTGGGSGEASGGTGQGSGEAASGGAGQPSGGGLLNLGLGGAAGGAGADETGGDTGGPSGTVLDLDAEGKTPPGAGGGTGASTGPSTGGGTGTGTGTGAGSQLAIDRPGDVTLPPMPGTRPMKRDDLPGLDRRILTLPGAILAVDPIAGGAEELPAFSIFYVYNERSQDGAAWLQVGRSAGGRIDGWIRKDQTEDWKTMLVMQYAPKGARERVLFFKRRNDLIQFVRDPHVAQEAGYAYEDIEAGAYDGDYFTAIEPATEVDPERPYLMPILDHHEDMFDNLEEVTLVEVAGLNLEAGPAQADVSETENFDAPRRSSAIRDFRFGVVFAIDTTSSMGRYIDHTRAVVYSVIKGFADAGLDDKVDFGLVGYRDNTAPNPAIDYVTRVFQPLDPNADIPTVLGNFDRMAPVTVSTKGWDEDAFAGLDSALNTMDWSPYDLRMVVLITDAGARRGTDPMAQNPGYDVLNIRENADRLGVALSVIHLLTPEGARAGNIPPAQQVYAEIARTGDTSTTKYFPVDTTRGDAFLGQIQSFADGLVGAVSQSARGRRVERVEAVETMGDALVNEVFRAQLEYLGARQGQAAPRFYRAWAADRDLMNPRLDALDVKVFVTRQQLSALMEGSEAILMAYESQETGGGDFFALMRSFSAASTVEGAGTRTLQEAGDLFPSFLKALPYKSDLLALDEDTWSASGPSFQREQTEALRNKLRAYRDIAGSEIGWIDLGAGNRAEDVYAVSLELLP
ncbi:hypothetical protein LNKW23_45540 [Paralimibaculum aggregatum]|uniref:VWFA domain-containing protein n=1 Tax=Paralimibaculum aggregatum TaxID=3036245 RepID=A0ABQ6LTD8_9RHOB|nr:vWA domain-containing protein [Limibaculum sp. NKW23]GMG85334.1 hypothetical protein LNKW23_45540 [Limibaculum sp. NKW23]